MVYNLFHLYTFLSTIIIYNYLYTFLSTIIIYNFRFHLSICPIIFVTMSTVWAVFL